MESKSRIAQDISQIQESVKKLSTGINQAGVNWKDDKIQALKASVSQLAGESRRVVEAGQKCNYTLRKFEEISAETY